MRCSARSLYRKDDGAVAPTIALSLFLLIAAGGVAFDYARLATMHTELQQAADQAALAAASQLDGGANACSRAAAAAANLLNNETYLANYGSGRAVTVTNESTCDATGVIKFYADYNQDTDTPGTAANSDATAKYVIVTVNGRQASYALTPIVGVFNSGTIAATAVATLGSGSICKIPPLMMCNPAETTGPGAVLTFDPDTYRGRGLKLEAGGGGTWAPGNYGYLDFGTGAPTVEQTMGSNVDSNPCVDASTVQTKPGNTASAPTGINVRFDVYDNGLIAYCAQGNGNCSPAVSVVKDIVHPQFAAGTPPNEFAKTSNPNADNCKLANGTDPWDLPAVQYQPDPATRLQAATLGDPTNMGSPRDICHAVSTDGDCGGNASRFGDGDWDRDLYFKVNYGTTGNGWQSLSWLSGWATANGINAAGLTTISRYNVYRAEAAAIAGGTLQMADGTDAKRRAVGTGYAYKNARCATPQAATASIKDRRVLTAAVVNCTAGGVAGATHITPIGWVDLFLVEPSINRPRTGADQIYVEIIGGATKPDGSGPFQYFLKQRPRLVR